MAGLIDSCVLLDVFTEDPNRFEWSVSSQAHPPKQGVFVIKQNNTCKGVFY